MDKLSQKNIDQYLLDKNLNEEQKERVLLAITPIVYQRNQNVIKAEAENDEQKRKQYTRSVEEYDQIIEDRISEALDGKAVEIYDF